MSRIAVVCPSATGHLNPSLTLAATLQQRGHEVLFYALPDNLQAIERMGFAHRVYATREFPPGALARNYAQLGELTGRQAVRHTIELVRQRTVAGLRDLPALLREDRPTGMVIDQMLIAAAAVARSERIPYVTVSNALLLNEEPAIPPVFTTWPYAKRPWTRLRNRLAYAAFHRMTRPVLDVLNDFQDRQGLPRYPHIDSVNSPLAHVVQQPAEFDFPRRHLAPTVHYAGPFHSLATRAAVEFPYDRLSDLPLVYASMGTLQNRVRGVFRSIAEACTKIRVQLVISLGGGAGPDEFADLPGTPLVVRYAPQLQLLQRATLCITHAGLNTALEALGCGVPLLAIPVTNDQPGVAARIQWLGAGRCLPIHRLRAGRIETALHDLFDNRRYRSRARALQQIIQALDGPGRAAEIVEQAFVTGKPVLRADAPGRSAQVSPP